MLLLLLALLCVDVPLEDSEGILGGVVEDLENVCSMNVNQKGCSLQAGRGTMYKYAEVLGKHAVPSFHKAVHIPG